MNNLERYESLMEDDFDQFLSLVNTYLSLGYVPQGGVSVVRYGEDLADERSIRYTYTQAVFKPR